MHFSPSSSPGTWLFVPENANESTDVANIKALCPAHTAGVVLRLEEPTMVADDARVAQAKFRVYDPTQPPVPDDEALYVVVKSAQQELGDVVRKIIGTKGVAIVVAEGGFGIFVRVVENHIDLVEDEAPGEHAHAAA